MSNYELAMLMAGMAKLFGSLMLACTEYMGGDPRPEKRERSIKRIKGLAKQIDDLCAEVTAVATEVDGAE